MAGPSYLGIDLTSSARHPSGYAVIDDGPRLLAVGLVREDEDILALALHHGSHIVAIDAPLGLPAGLCCLEESCACLPTAPDGLRACERELRWRGIGLFYTTKRSIIKRMVYRAIGLRGRLEAEGLRAVEVFPYATKLLLFGKPLPKKTTPEGVAYLRGCLEPLVKDLSTQGPLTHDELDGVVAAYTAYLLAHNRAEEVGDAVEAAICIPQSVRLQEKIR